MTDQKPAAPPYVAYKTFVNFIDTTLREDGVPSRIDLSLWGARPSGAAYATLAALKFLGLIDNQGRPSDQLRELVSADQAQRKVIFSEVLKDSYPGLFADSFNLKEATAGQFDEIICENYNIHGSTVDKVAGFFISAAEDVGLPLSTHIRSRKRIAGASPKRAKKSKLKSNAEVGVSQESVPLGRSIEIENTISDQKQRPEIVLLDMIDMAEMSPEEQQAVWTLIQYLKRKDAGLTKKSGHGSSE